jgi:hypothetical protein
MAFAPDGAKMSPFKVDEKGGDMGEIATVGLDLAKSVFQVHAVDAEGRVVGRSGDSSLSSSLQGCRPA